LDYDRGRLPRPWYTSRSFELLRWDYDHIDRETLDFVASLPEQRTIEVDGAAPIRMVHGSPRNVSEKLCPVSGQAVLDLMLAHIGEPVLVCGHTHIPWKAWRAGKLALNPGAVCGPLNGEVGAQYALLRWCGDYWQVEHRTVTYDLYRVREAFEISGLLDKGGVFARAVLLAIQTGQNVPEEFLAYAHGLAAQAGFENRDTVPDEIWEQASVTFNWGDYENETLGCAIFEARAIASPVA